MDPSIASHVSSILSFTDPFLASSSSSAPAVSLFCPEQQFVLSYGTSSVRKGEQEQKENGMVSTELSLGLPGSFPSKKPKVDQERRAAILDQSLLGQKPSKDPRLIRKTLTFSDVNGSCRLLLLTKDVEDYVLSSMEEDKAKMCKTNTGVRFEVWDLDDESCGGHHLVLKKWAGANSFVLNGGWKKNFVNRKGLQEGDEIGFAFDGTRFYFQSSRHHVLTRHSL
ncbi:hypothetical protein LguiB_028849 [Lonicera macranthoides]